MQGQADLAAQVPSQVQVQVGKPVLTAPLHQTLPPPPPRAKRLSDILGPPPPARAPQADMQVLPAIEVPGDEALPGIMQEELQPGPLAQAMLIQAKALSSLVAQLSSAGAGLVAGFLRADGSRRLPGPGMAPGSSARPPERALHGSHHDAHDDTEAVFAASRPKASSHDLGLCQGARLPAKKNELPKPKPPTKPTSTPKGDPGSDEAALSRKQLRAQLWAAKKAKGT